MYDGGTAPLKTHNHTDEDGEQRGVAGDSGQGRVAFLDGGGFQADHHEVTSIS